jgi:hypothetical protein
MTDTTGNETVMLKVKLKGDCGEVEVDPSKITDMDIYQYIFQVGLETIVNKVGMSKIAAGITKAQGEDKVKRTAEIVEQAQKTVQAMYDGDLKGAKATSKRSGAVNTEAMRLAKALVKDTLRNNGYKISAFDAKEITAYAKEVLKANSELYKKAQENLEQRAALPVKGLDVSSMLGERTGDESLKAKPKVPPKPKAKAKDAIMSAAEAGKVAPRQKPHAATAH